MRLKLALTIMTLAVAAPPAGAASPTAPVKLTVPGTGISCVMTSASVSCRGRPRRSRCRRRSHPPASSRRAAGRRRIAGLRALPGASYKNAFLVQPEPRVGPFACIPIGLGFKPLGAVCAIVSSGNGFRITAGNVAKVNQIPPAPIPHARGPR